MSKTKRLLLCTTIVLALLATVLTGCEKELKEVVINSPEDLKGLTVGCQVATTAHESCEEFLKTIDFTLKTYDQIIQTFTDLKTGRLDAVVVDEVVARYYVMQEPESYMITGSKLTNEPIGVCFKKSNTAMRDTVNAIIDKFQKDGTLKELSEKWFGEDLTENLEKTAVSETKIDKTPFEGKTVLKIGVDDVYPPMEYKNDKNETVGFDIDLAKAIGKELGLKVEFVSTAWDGIFTSLNTDKYDVIISSISINDERQQNFALTKPYVNNAQVIVVRAPKDKK